MAPRRKKDATAALAAVSDLDVKRIMDDVGATQTKVQEVMAGLGITMASKVEQLKQLDDAIEAKKQELKDTHTIEVLADTLEHIQEQVVEAQAEADKQSKHRNARWIEEAQQHAKEVERQTEEFAYTQKQRLQQAEAEFLSKKQEWEQQERFRRQDLERQMETRAEELKNREAAVREQEEKLNSFDERLKAETAKAVATATSAMKREHDHTVLLLQKDSDAASALAAANVQAMQQTISELQAQNTELSKQLQTAREDSKAIAQSAVEASSQRQALAAIQGTIETQARAQGGSGRSGR